MASHRVVAAVLAALLATALGACSASDPPTGATASRPAPTALVDLDPAQMTIPRIAFCDLVPERDVLDALGGPTKATTTWGNGDPAPVGEQEVAHEFGCAWTGTDGVVARAWIFGRPVSAGFARVLVHQARREAGCRSRLSADFGRPTVLQRCELAAPDGAGREQLRVRRAGLFGATWLTC